MASKREREPMEHTPVLSSSDSNSEEEKEEYMGAREEEGGVNHEEELRQRAKRSSYHHRGKNTSKHAKISNAEIYQTVKSLENRISKLEDSTAEIIRLLYEIKQNNPTFLTSGRSGSVNSSHVTGGKTTISPPY